MFADNTSAWNLTTRETVLNPATEAFVAYGGYKTLAEQALWDFADAHPHMNITAGQRQHQGLVELPINSSHGPHEAPVCRRRRLCDATTQCPGGKCSFLPHLLRPFCTQEGLGIAESTVCVAASAVVPF